MTALYVAQIIFNVAVTGLIIYLVTAETIRFRNEIRRGHRGLRHDEAMERQQAGLRPFRPLGRRDP